MKKFAVLFFSSLILASCSRDKAENQNVFNGILLKKIVCTSSAGIIETKDYFYYGNMITEVHNSPTEYIRYVYQNTTLVRANKYLNGVINKRIMYEYNYLGQINRILYLSMLSSGLSFRFMHTYNSDGIISCKKYSGDVTNQNDLVEDFKLFFNDSNVYKKEIYKLINGNMETITHTYTYDNKNNPLNRIVDFRKLLMFDTGSPMSNNNLTSTTITATNTSNIGVYTSQYTYNIDNFPITRTDTNPDGSTYVTQFTY